jgi:phenylacetic acid degradation operon negative regulatory protein
MLRPHNPKSLLLNLLLAAGPAPLAARDAVAAGALFGMRENSLRVALARLAADGLVASADRGHYRLGPNARDLAADVATWRHAEARVEPWSGAWIAVYVAARPGASRSERRAQTRAFQMLGLRELEPGLFLRPNNLAGGADDVRARLGALGQGAGLAVFTLADLDLERDARARRLWDGARLSKSYVAGRRRLEAWLAKRDRLDLDDAARESYLLGNDAIRQLVFDPLLPEPLVDVAARRAFVAVVQRFDAAGRAIWKRRRLLPQKAAPRRP